MFLVRSAENVERKGDDRRSVRHEVHKMLKTKEKLFRACAECVKCSHMAAKKRLE
jgi:hypothetical protein